MSAVHRVVIVGGGFGGLNAARSLRNAPVDVTLIDRRNFHLFQPLLYQVATGGLSPANIASPLRGVLQSQRNCRVVLGEVTGFDVASRQVIYGSERLPYDSLVVAAGAVTSYFNHPEWEKVATGLKSVEEATHIRAHVLAAFEAAERYEIERRLTTGEEPPQTARSADPVLRHLLTFVIVGGGPTGVEMAGAVSELARHTLRSNFRCIDPAGSRIILIEGADRLLPPFPPSLSRSAQYVLERRMGVEVWTSARVQAVNHDHVIAHRLGGDERIDTSTVIWAAGVKASPLGKLLGDATGAVVDRGGRVVVNRELTLEGRPEIFVIGDLAAATYPDGKQLPGLAPVAMQQGRYVAKVIAQRVAGKTKIEPFRYWDKGTMATIGRNAAVVDLYWLRFSGWLAWMTWLFVHIMFIVQFQNRLLVMMQWFWNYVTRNRAARLITEDEAIRILMNEKAAAAAERSPAKPTVGPSAT